MYGVERRSLLAAIRSALDMPLLTLSMAGSQLMWCLELGYGTPYLLSIGLSKEAISLVWIAGPLSGLIAQPIIGSLSDSSTSSFRRRKYMIGSTVVLAFAASLIAFAGPVSQATLNVLGIGLGTWDPVYKEYVQHMVQALSIIGFWLLDFALNALQVVSRALILDHADVSGQNRANAWHGRMLHVGKIVGYWCGWVDLSKVPILAWVGGDQFRKFAVICIVCVVATVGVTCSAMPEPAAERTRGHLASAGNVWGRLIHSVSHVCRVTRNLPPSIRSVCCVQIFNTMGWFPFLFYSTTFVINRASARAQNGDLDAKEQIGSFAMLLFAVLSLVSGAVLPFFSLAGTDTDTQDVDIYNGTTRVTNGLLRFASLRSLWVFGMILHALFLLVGTWVASSPRATVMLVMLMGIPWSISCWVPYALIGEFVRESEKQMSEYGGYLWHPAAERRVYGHQSAGDANNDAPRVQRKAAARERIPSTASQFNNASCYSSIVSRGSEVSRSPSDAAADDCAHGGTILGIHNLAIVLPQFVVSLVVTLIFRIADHVKRDVQRSDDDGIVWVMRFGGAMALCAIFVTRLIPLTLTERSTMDVNEYERLPQGEEDESENEPAP